MLTSRVPSRRLELPHEPGSWIEVRSLSGLQLQHARAAAQHERVLRMQEMGPDMVTATIRNADPEAIKAAQAENSDPLSNYDRRTLLLEGIVDWSYTDAPVTPENIDDLDEVTMQYVAEALVPKVATEDDRKNGSEPSTTISAGGPKSRQTPG